MRQEIYRKSGGIFCGGYSTSLYLYSGFTVLLFQGDGIPDIKRISALTIATGLGSGYSPFAPGTAGSAVGVLVVWLAAGLGWWGYAAVAAVVFITGTWAASIVEEMEGAKDPGKITVDEISGMMVTMAFLPATPLMLAAGFLLFRVLDILKPFPAGLIDKRVRGGLGVMLDDVVAGVYANLVLQAVGAYMV